MNNSHSTTHPDEITTSNKLHEIIKKEVSQNNGSIPLSQYIELCLYHKNYGYYHNQLHKFGKMGDFVTAPGISHLFGYSLGTQIDELFNHMEHKNIVELGAGNGQLMIDILSHIGDDIDTYYVLEISAVLIFEMQQKLQNAHPKYVSKVKWIDKLPIDFDGVIIANELLDANPTDSYIYKDDEIYRIDVGCVENKFVYTNKKYSNDDIKMIIDNLPEITKYNNFIIDINLNSLQLMKNIANSLNSGYVILIDYGYCEREFYSPKHMNGTVRGFIHHTKVDNILEHPPGLMDITASVNFTAIANAGIANGLDLIDYTTQGAFLINCGILNHVEHETENETQVTKLKYNNEINRLTSINDMGEVFKVIAFSKNIDFYDLLGFKAFSLARIL